MAMQKPKPEKRSARRVPVKAPVNVKLLKEVEETVPAHTRDISTRGVFLYVQARVLEGSILEVVLPIPEGIMPTSDTWMRCKCRVVRVEQVTGGSDYGVAAMIEECELMGDSEYAQA